MTVAEHVDHAAERLRSANHAAHGALDISASYAVVGNLSLLIARLPFLLDQLRRSVRRADPGEHYDDRPDVPVARTLVAALDRLDDLRVLALDLDEHARAAHNHLGHIGRRLTED